ncbi:hypothetical protein [Micromonospora sp. NPDC049900]
MEMIIPTAVAALADFVADPPNLVASVAALGETLHVMWVKWVS